MERITQKDLEKLVRTINRITNSPLEIYTRNKKGFTANVGNYHLDYAYGGVRLAQIMGVSGGIRVISQGGFGTKRELFNWMLAFVTGFNLKKDLN